MLYLNYIAHFFPLLFISILFPTRFLSLLLLPSLVFIAFPANQSLFDVAVWVSLLYLTASIVVEEFTK